VKAEGASEYPSSVPLSAVREVFFSPPVFGGPRTTAAFAAVHPSFWRSIKARLSFPGGMPPPLLGGDRATSSSSPPSSPCASPRSPPRARQLSLSFLLPLKCCAFGEVRMLWGFLKFLLHHNSTCSAPFSLGTAHLFLQTFRLV